NAVEEDADEPGVAVAADSAGDHESKTEPAAGKKSAAKVPAARKTSRPKPAKTNEASLVQLVRVHLAGREEPISSGEVTEALAAEQPGRSISSQGVRMALETLVANGQAQRSKQGRSVFYQRASAPITATQPPTVSKAATSAAHRA